ncbi:MAG: hypothetical protein OEX08_01965 [Candidatus Nomurabacteria bacterium]|nr:hypothetical protein [Candidatus Nomurabacteria bacterium]
MQTIIGATGATIILIFFLLNQTNIIKKESVWYDLGNAIGAGIMIWYSILLWSVPFLILNIVWAAFSACDVVKFFVQNKK